jgi:hypothetical protein
MAEEDKEQLKVLRKEEQVLEEKITQLMAAKNAAMATFDEQIADAELALRTARYKLVDGGLYKSWWAQDLSLCCGRAPCPALYVRSTLVVAGDCLKHG